METSLSRESYTKLLINEIFSKSNDEDSHFMAKYMKDKFAFLGIKSPIRKLLLKNFKEKNGLLPANEIRDFTIELYSNKYREIQYFALEYLETAKFYNLENSIDLFESLVITNSWWDSVDFISTRLIGKYFLKFPEKQFDITDKWNQSDNMWLVRVSITHQLLYKEKTNIDKLSLYILNQINSNEFFIQKAIGWALRQYSKYDSTFVYDFVNSNKLKPLSKREALKLITK
jgi:3-methyladenine DNA glycosylase AlkD